MYNNLPLFDVVHHHNDKVVKGVHVMYASMLSLYNENGEEGGEWYQYLH